jgi:hypothetical protein
VRLLAELLTVLPNHVLVNPTSMQVDEDDEEVEHGQHMVPLSDREVLARAHARLQRLVQREHVNGCLRLMDFTGDLSGDLGHLSDLCNQLLRLCLQPADRVQLLSILAFRLGFIRTLWHQLQAMGSALLRLATGAALEPGAAVVSVVPCLHLFAGGPGAATNSGDAFSRQMCFPF